MGRALRSVNVLVIGVGSSVRESAVELPDESELQAVVAVRRLQEEPVLPAGDRALGRGHLGVVAGGVAGCAAVGAAGAVCPAAGRSRTLRGSRCSQRCVNNVVNATILMNRCLASNTHTQKKKARRGFPRPSPSLRP